MGWMSFASINSRECEDVTEFLKIAISLANFIS